MPPLEGDLELRQLCKALVGLDLNASFEDVYLHALKIEQACEELNNAHTLYDPDLALLMVASIGDRMPFLMPAMIQAARSLTSRIPVADSLSLEGLYGFLKHLPDWSWCPCRCGMTKCTGTLIGHENVLSHHEFHRAIELHERDRLLDIMRNPYANAS